MLEIRHLRYFVAVAEELNVTRAAERLHTAQPSLSQQIRQLEDLVGVPLFTRYNHRFELTYAGRIFLKEARRILQRTDKAVHLAHAAARGEAGQLTVSFVPSASVRIFPRLLQMLYSKYPDISLELRSMATPKQFQGLREHTIDVGFVREAIDDSELTSDHIVREPLVAVIPAGSQIARKREISPKELAGLPLIELPRVAEPVLHDAIREFCAYAGLGHQRIPSLDSLEAILNMVASGAGFTLLPDYVEQMLPTGARVCRFLCSHVPELNVYVAYRKNDEVTAVKTLLSLVAVSLSTDV